LGIAGVKAVLYCNCTVEKKWKVAGYRVYADRVGKKEEIDFLQFYILLVVKKNKKKKKHYPTRFGALETCRPGL